MFRYCYGVILERLTLVMVKEQRMGYDPAGGSVSSVLSSSGTRSGLFSTSAMENIKRILDSSHNIKILKS